MRRAGLLTRQGRGPATLGLPYWLWDPRVLTDAEAGAVASLTDRGPQAVHAVQTVAGNKPLMGRGVNGINGVPALIYDAVDDYMTADAVAASFTGSDMPVTMLYVAQSTNLSGQGTAMSLGRAASSTPSHRLRVNTSTGPAFTRTDDAALTKAISVSSLLANGNPFVCLHRFNGTVGDLWHNGRRVSGVTDLDTGTITFDRFTLGIRRGASVVTPWAGKLGIQVVVTGWIADEAARLLSRWAMDAYGIGR